MPKLADNTIAAKEPCQQCTQNPAEFQCMQCKAFYCAACGSGIDPENFCKNCLKDDSVQITQVDKLVDDEGVEHEGRLITPTGDGIKTVVAAISEMSQYQLESHIEHFRGLVKQAELTLERRRVILATSEVEAEGRKLIERRKLRGYKLTAKQQGASAAIKAASGANGKATDPNALAAAVGSVMKGGGKGMEALIAMLQAKVAASKKP